MRSGIEFRISVYDDSFTVTQIPSIQSLKSAWSINDRLWLYLNNRIFGVFAWKILYLLSKWCPQKREVDKETHEQPVELARLTDTLSSRLFPAVDGRSTTISCQTSAHITGSSILPSASSTSKTVFPLRNNAHAGKWRGLLGIMFHLFTLKQWVASRLSNTRHETTSLKEKKKSWDTCINMIEDWRWMDDTNSLYDYKINTSHRLSIWKKDIWNISYNGSCLHIT